MFFGHRCELGGGRGRVQHCSFLQRSNSVYRTPRFSGDLLLVSRSKVLTEKVTLRFVWETGFKITGVILATPSAGDFFLPPLSRASRSVSGGMRVRTTYVYSTFRLVSPVKSEPITFLRCSFRLTREFCETEVFS